jgi:CheY-like chemotaxis protein
VQVLANLLGNAAKYTREGGRLAVRVGVTHDQVWASVLDNGIGIAADLLPTVFDLVSQAERTPDRSQGGLGLGLALVKSLVELHGGMVTVASEGRDRGSEFTVRLPRLEGRSAAQGAPAPGSVPTPSAHSLRIMLVDDNVDAALTLGLLMESSGHHVTVAHTPQEALARADGQAFDLFLLDIGLPGMSGYELARHLRALPGAQAATMAAITGYGQQSDHDHAAEAGFDRYFVKPVEPEDLFALLAQVAARPA